MLAAGGSGALTFELAFVHGIKCTLVEPRPLKLHKLQHRQLQQSGRTVSVRTYILEQLQQAWEAHGAALPTTEHDMSQQDVSLPLQQQSCPGQADIATNIPGAEDRCSGAAVHQATVVSTDQCLELQQVQAWFGPELWGTQGWQQLFGACSCVVGLHPDQATEAILEYAVQRDAPFALMPCCVFPRLFPHRRLQQEDGSQAVPVTSYEELVEYLQQQGRAERQVLDFEGANTVVYRV